MDYGQSGDEQIVFHWGVDVSAHAADGLLSPSPGYFAAATIRGGRCQSIWLIFIKEFPTCQFSHRGRCSPHRKRNLCFLGCLLAASFQYPQGWVRTGENVTVIKEDGSKPAERFNAINRDKDATALLVYEAGAKPRQVLTQRQIHDAIDTGIQKQVDATQEDLVYFRSTSGFGCVADFNYTHKPTLVERDGMYGYSYGYTCETYKGAVTGEYFVAFDDAGISHRMTVEALQTEWERNKEALSAIIDSLKPAL